MFNTMFKWLYLFKIKAVNETLIDGCDELTEKIIASHKRHIEFDEDHIKFLEKQIETCEKLIESCGDRPDLDDCKQDAMGWLIGYKQDITKTELHMQMSESEKLTNLCYAELNKQLLK